MECYKLYKHKNFTDVAILVTGIIPPTEDKLVARVEWYLSNGIRTITMGITDFITIKKSDLINWYEVK